MWSKMIRILCSQAVDLADVTLRCMTMPDHLTWLGTMTFSNFLKLVVHWSFRKRKDRHPVHSGIWSSYNQPQLSSQLEANRKSLNSKSNILPLRTKFIYPLVHKSAINPWTYLYGRQVLIKLSFFCKFA